MLDVVESVRKWLCVVVPVYRLHLDVGGRRILSLNPVNSGFTRTE